MAKQGEENREEKCEDFVEAKAGEGQEYRNNDMEAVLSGVFRQMTIKQKAEGTMEDFLCKFLIEESFSAVEKLELTTVIFYFPVKMPSLEAMNNWVREEERCEEEGMRTIIRAYAFLLKCCKEDTRKKLLGRKIEVVGGCEGCFIPWSPESEKKNFVPALLPIWVELCNVSSMFEQGTDKLFASLGRVLEISTDPEIAHSKNPRACIEWNPRREPPKTICIKVGEMRLEQEVCFFNLPNGCHRCNRSAHWMRDCPYKQSASPAWYGKLAQGVEKANTRAPEGDRPMTTPEVRKAEEEGSEDELKKMREDLRQWRTPTDHSQGLKRKIKKLRWRQRRDLAGALRRQRILIPTSGLCITTGKKQTTKQEPMSEETERRVIDANQDEMAIEEWKHQEGKREQLRTGKLCCAMGREYCLNGGSWRIGAALLLGSTSEKLAEVCELGTMDFMAIQDFKVTKEELAREMKCILPDFVCIASTGVLRDGTALLIRKGVDMVEWGSTVSGEITWAKIVKENISTWIVSILGCRHLTSRLRSWAFLTNFMLGKEEEGLICGDWGVAPIRGAGSSVEKIPSEEERCVLQELESRHEWRDLWLVASDKAGSLETWAKEGDARKIARTSRALCKNILVENTKKICIGYVRMEGFEFKMLRVSLC